MNKFFVILSAFVLSACGGGGASEVGTAPATPAESSTSTLPFELNEAITNVYNLPHTFNMEGQARDGRTLTARISFDPQPEATFEGIQSKVSNVTLTVREGKPTPIPKKYTKFFNFFPLRVNGATAVADQNGFNYFVPTSTNRLPASANVGSTGPVASGNFFINGAKALPTGTGVITYSVEPDTANTAFLCLHSTFQNTFNIVLTTQSECFRIRPDGTVLGLKFALGVYERAALVETIQFQ